jgi:hypothetical protein
MDVVIISVSILSFKAVVAKLPWSCLLSTVCCLLSAVCCLLSTVCCLLPAVCCLLPAVCCLLSSVCCLLSAVCCCYTVATLLLHCCYTVVTLLLHHCQGPPEDLPGGGRVLRQDPSERGAAGRGPPGNGCPVHAPDVRSIHTHLYIHIYEQIHMKV